MTTFEWQWQAPGIEQSLADVINEGDIRGTKAWSETLREADRLLNCIRMFSPEALSPLPAFIELYFNKLVKTTVAHAAKKGISIERSRTIVAERARTKLSPVLFKAAAKNAAADLIERVPVSWIVQPQGSPPAAGSAALPLDGGGGGGAPAAAAPLPDRSTSQQQAAIHTSPVSSTATAPLPVPSTLPIRGQSLKPIEETPPLSSVAAAAKPASSKSPLQAMIEANERDWGAEVEDEWAKVVTTLPSTASVEPLGQAQVASAAGSPRTPSKHGTTPTVPVSLSSSAPFVSTAAAAAASIPSISWTAELTANRGSGSSGSSSSSICGASGTSTHGGSKKRSRSAGSSLDHPSMPPPAAVPRWFPGPAPSTMPLPPVEEGSEYTPSKKRRRHSEPASAEMEVGPRMVAGASWPPPPLPPPPGRAGEAGEAGEAGGAGEARATWTGDAWAAGAGVPRVASDCVIPESSLPIEAAAARRQRGERRH